MSNSRASGGGHFRGRGRAVATPAPPRTDDLTRVGPDLDLDDGRGTLAVGDIGLPATGADARILRRVALFGALIEPGPRGAAMTGSAALLAALAPRPRLLLLLALSPEQRLRQHGPARAELRKLGFQRLDAGHQRLLLDLQSPHLGAQPSDLLAQRHDHARGPHGRRQQPLVALPQPGDVLLQPIDLALMPGLDPLLVVVGPPQQPAEFVDLALQELDPAAQALRRSRSYFLLQPGVLLPQRRDRLLRIPRSPRSRARPDLRRRHGRAQPGGLHAQGHDRAALARYNAGFRKELLQPRHLGLQGKGVLRRAADFLDLLFRRLQLAPAFFELRLQRTRPGTRVNSARRSSSQRASAPSARARSRSYSDRKSSGAHAGAVCEGDQIRSSPSASVRSVSKSSSRIAMRSTVALGLNRYQGRFTEAPGPQKRPFDPPAAEQLLSG